MEHPRIHRDPDIMVGKPCIKGTRITVEHILRELGAGASHQSVMTEYDLSADDIAAALAFAADYIGHESLIAA